MGKKEIKIEEDLLLIEKKFQTISEMVMDCVVVTENKEIIDANKKFIQLFECNSLEEITGSKIDQYFIKGEYKKYERVKNKGSVDAQEIKAKTPSGNEYYLEIKSALLDYESRNIEVHALKNVSNRKRVEIALEQSTERFRRLIENTPNAIYILVEGKIMFSNIAGNRLLGYEEEDEIYEKDFISFFSGKGKNEVEKDITEIREGEIIDYREFKITVKNIGEVYVGFKGSLTVYEGKPAVQISLNNVTDEKRLTKEKLRAELAEETNEALKTEINKRKETQKQLEAAEGFLSNIINSSIDMIIAVDEKDEISEFNLAVEKQYGHNTEELTKMNSRSLFLHEEDYDFVKQEIQEKGAFSGEVLNKKKNGEVFTSYLSASVIKDKNGNTHGSMGVSRDITEIKKSQENLIRSEEKFRLLYENMSEAYLVIDNEANIMQWNKSAEVLLDRKIRKQKEVNFINFIEEENKEEIKKLLCSKQAAKKLEHINLRIISDIGVEKFIEINATPVVENEFKEGYKIIVRNITQEKLAERKILEQSAKLNSIFESAHNMMMYTLNDKLEVKSFNNKLEKTLTDFFGVKIKEGVKFTSLISDFIDQEAYYGDFPYYEMGFNKKSAQFETPFIRKDGKQIWFETFINPIYVDGNVNEVSCIAYDITEKKEIENQIRNSLKEKEVLLQEVHHRVKNNLQVISSILYLQSGYVKDENTLSILTESQNRIKSMSFIHQSLYQTTDFASVEFTDYILQLVESLIHTYSINREKITLKTQIDRVYLSIDNAIPCGLIINEIVSNALKYAFPNEAEGIIELSVKEKHNKIIVRVSDNGIGIPDNIDPIKNDSLGLQLIHTLVEQLDAEMEIDSKNGTSFLITFDK